MELHLIRHTKVEVPDSICFGQSDVALRDTWRADLSLIQLPEDYHSVYTSPLKRCVQLAEFFNLNYISDSRLIEMSFGEWEMMPWDDIPPDQIQPWYEDFINVTPPGGENLLSLKNRLQSFLDMIENLHPQNKILVITHSGVIRLFLHLILGFPMENMFRLQPQHGKRVVIQKHNSVWKIEGFNW
jgi:alpha-ribazole phosphatase